MSQKLPTIKQLQCFLAVAQELNFRKAAERMNMTQPPLTRQIQSLEEVLDCVLFLRSTHRVALTEEGAQLVVKAEHLINEFTLFMREIRQDTAPLRIGLTRTLNFEQIPALDNKIRELRHSAQIEIPHYTSVQLLKSLLKEERDLVLAGEHGAQHDADLDFAPIWREPLRLALPASHPACALPQVALAEVADLPLFWFSRSANPAFFDKCERYFQRLPFTLKRIREPDDSLVLLSAIASGQGFALMPQSMCTFAHPDLCYRDLTAKEAEALNIMVYAVTRKNDRRPAVVAALEKLSKSSG